MEYLCSQPVIIDDWYHELSSHKPLSAKGQPVGEKELKMFREIEQKMLIYQEQGSCHTEEIQSDQPHQKQPLDTSNHDRLISPCKETLMHSNKHDTTSISQEDFSRLYNKTPKRQQPESKHLATGSPVPLLDARYEVITPPCEDISQNSPFGFEFSQYEAITPPPIELPQSVSSDQYCTTAETQHCFYEYQNKSLLSSHFNYSTWCGTYPFTQNCGYIHYNAYGNIQNLNNPLSLLI